MNQILRTETSGISSHLSSAMKKRGTEFKYSPHRGTKFFIENRTPPSKFSSALYRVYNFDESDTQRSNEKLERIKNISAER